MWNNRLAYIGLGAILLCACQREVAELEPAPEDQETRQVATLTIQASKAAHTKALSLDGSTLNAYWKDNESVGVYDDAGNWLGELDVTPAEGEKPSSATLSGPLDVTNLTAGDHLTLWIPWRMGSYTGQVGTLSGENSIEENYDYASASLEVVSILENVITTTGPARFNNEQSIYRFGFKEEEVALSVRLFVVGAASNKLVQSVTLGETKYGAFRVKPAAATTDFLYVSIRNESVGPACAEDTYRFIGVGSDQSAYLGAKAIPVSVLDRQGKFIGPQRVVMTKVLLPKSDALATDVW